ncbi:homocysteine S-methyltransferase [Limosilactobacillus fermentum]|nr:homocysteine S-methyltransferase [Limosilactobacillus fermentum]
MSKPLEVAGAKTNSDLWAAQTLIDNPDLVYQVHLDYFKAGADLTITDTYQTNVDALVRHGLSEEEARDLIKRAVQLANQARDDYEKETGKHNYVAGSIGPYGAYLADGSEYRGDYDLTAIQLQNFHLPRLAAILATGVDCLALETQPKLTEVVAILALLINISRKSRDFSHGMDRPLLSPFMGLFVCFCIFLVIDIFLDNFFAHIAQCTHIVTRRPKMTAPILATSYFWMIL